jgi:flagellar FliJ protein
MESVLKFRKRQEEMAHLEFVEAQHRVSECLRGIDQMYKQIDSAREDIAKAVFSGSPADLHYVRASETFIDGQKFRIQQARLRARDLIRELESKEEELLQRLHDRKIMEKLKDRRLQEYMEHLARLEQKELDDLTNSRRAGGRS